MATIDVEIDLEEIWDEISDKDLMRELKKRDIQIPRRRTLGASVEGLYDNLSDEMKLEAFLEVFKNIPEAELDNFLKNYK